MRMDTSGFRFQGEFKTTDGRKFRGIIFSNTLLTGVSEVAEYILRAGLQCFVRPGDAIIYEGTKYLIATGVTEHSAFPLFRLYRMITITDELPWSRTATVEDDVTGAQRAADSPTTLGTALCAMVSTTKIVDAFKVNSSKFRLITNAAIQVNDELGRYTVTFVEKRFGLAFAEVR